MGSFKEVRRIFGRELKKAKCNHWRDWLEKSSDPDLWMAHRYITAPSGDRDRTRIPDLEQLTSGGKASARNNEEKSNMLAKSFFPQKPATHEERVTKERHKEKPICKVDPIIKEQIKRALVRLKPYKVPGLDGIPNIVLLKCADVLIDRLWYIYSAIWDRNMYYDPWKDFTTVVLHKPGKPRCDTPKAYRPIALLNTMGKY